MMMPRTRASQYGAGRTASGVVTAAVASRVAATVAVPVGATATARVATQCVCVVVFFFAKFTTFIELERVTWRSQRSL